MQGEEKEQQNYGMSSLEDRQAVDALLGAQVSLTALYLFFLKYG